MNFEWLNADSRKFLEQGYLLEGQSPEERVRDICNTAEKICNIDGFSDRLFEMVRRGWVSFASPVWSNFGNDRGLPISCFGSYVDDSIEDILSKVAEIGTMTKAGGGTSAYIGALRATGSPISVGGKADGPARFAELFDTVTNIVSQSNVRRGHCSVFFDIEHPDIKQLLKIRDVGNPIQNLSFGVCVSDEWMKALISGDKDKEKIWKLILKKRFESGFPYIFWKDTVNKNSPFDEEIFATNMCTEIALPSSKDYSFVCCLSSVNLLYWDEWKNSDLVEVMTVFLDCVMEEFIQKTEGVKFLENANRFAKKYRALGLGTLGWHSYLQSKMIPFESLEAKLINAEIYRTMRERAETTSQGRNRTLLAIAPTTSSSFILGQVSPSIEPLNSNYFTKDLAKGKFGYRNPYLKKLLTERERDDETTWRSILEHGGSVQHLEFLSRYEKEVFKTFGEISQAEIIIQASQRQKYIDQAQSLNLMIHPNAPLKDVNSLMIKAWELGVKTLYYQRSTNPSQELMRSLLDCTSCEA